MENITFEIREEFWNNMRCPLRSGIKYHTNEKVYKELWHDILRGIQSKLVTNIQNPIRDSL